MKRREYRMKITSFIFLLCLGFANLHSSECRPNFCFPQCCGTPCCSDLVAEVRAGYFYPNSKKFRDIYKHGGAEGELEVSGTYMGDWKWFGNANYFYKKGHSLGFYDKTTIRMIPVSLGLKYQFCFFRGISPYLGLGISYTFTKINNHSDYVKRHVNKNGFGFVVKSGVTFDLSCNFILDLFVDYYNQHLHFHHHHNAEMGGFKTGAGIGYRF